MPRTLDEWAPDADPNEALFRPGSSVVDAMVKGVATDVLARYFEYWLLRLQGVYNADPRLSGAARAFLDAARISDPCGMADVPAAPAVLRELERAHRSLMRLHLEKELKSTRVLKEMADRKTM